MHCTLKPELKHIKIHVVCANCGQEFKETDCEEREEPPAKDIGESAEIATFDVFVKPHRCKPHGWKP